MHIRPWFLGAFCLLVVAHSVGCSRGLPKSKAKEILDAALTKRGLVGCYFNCHSGLLPVSLDIPCAKESVSEIKSVTTEGRKARVQYTVHTELTKPDEAKAKNCNDGVVKPGLEVRTSTLSQDDDGNWSVLFGDL